MRLQHSRQVRVWLPVDSLEGQWEAVRRRPGELGLGGSLYHSPVASCPQHHLKVI